MLRGCQRVRANEGEETYSRRRRGVEPSRAVLLSSALAFFFFFCFVFEDTDKSSRTFTTSPTQSCVQHTTPPVLQRHSQQTAVFCHMVHVYLFCFSHSYLNSSKGSGKNSKARHTGLGMFGLDGSCNVTRMRLLVVGDSQCQKYISQVCIIVTRFPPCLCKRLQWQPQASTQACQTATAFQLIWSLL